MSHFPFLFLSTYSPLFFTFVSSLHVFHPSFSSPVSLSLSLSVSVHSHLDLSLFYLSFTPCLALPQLSLSLPLFLELSFFSCFYPCINLFLNLSLLSLPSSVLTCLFLLFTCFSLLCFLFFTSLFICLFPPVFLFKHSLFSSLCLFLSPYIINSLLPRLSLFMYSIFSPPLSAYHFSVLSVFLFASLSFLYLYLLIACLTFIFTPLVLSIPACLSLLCLVSLHPSF